MEDSFKLLEEKIHRAVERLKELQAETKSLRGELARARKRADEAEKQLEAASANQGAEPDAAKKADSLSREIKALRREREEIRSRLGRLVELLESLE